MEVNMRWLFLLWACAAIARPRPIGFSIPESKIVQQIPEKTQDFAFIIPGDRSTYIYEDETEYYADYQRSYYAVTSKKAGWDCMRHYEILANGCIPWFLDLDGCDQGTLYFFPKALVKEAMELPGVSFMHINHSLFDKERYKDVLTRLLHHTRTYLSCRAMAEYLLKSVNYQGGKVLFMSPSQYPDYLRCLTLIGLRQVLGADLIDAPKIHHLYDTYTGDTAALYGKGMTYTKILEDLPVDRDHIAERIAGQEFSLIIYGSAHRGMPYQGLVSQTYPADKIVYLCGEDAHRCDFTGKRHLFLREFNSYLPFLNNYPIPAPFQ
jgi:hypothetical protein